MVRWITKTELKKKNFDASISQVLEIPKLKKI